MVTTEKQVEYLVVDTTAFIQNAPLQDVGKNIVTCQEVVDEIINKRQLRRLCVLPYDLIIKDVFPESVHAVTDFTKKTGDYPSLSATDIKVMALTYQLEKEKVGVEHLRNEPIMQRSINISGGEKVDLNEDIAGFYKPNSKDKQNKSDKLENNQETNDKPENNEDIKGKIENKQLTNDNLKDSQVTNEKLDAKQEINDKLVEKQMSNDNLEGSQKKNVENHKNSINTLEHINDLLQTNDINSIEMSINFNTNKSQENTPVYDPEINIDELKSKFQTLTTESPFESNPEVDDILVAISDNDDESDSYSLDSEYDSDDDESSWITPSNIKEAKKLVNSEMMEEKSVQVACMTTDFAMQNVLKQMNLNVSALDGRMIRQLRTFILRCYTCFGTTSLMTKSFCPKCGNSTLKRVAVSLDENGKQQIHINVKKPLTGRGKRFSLPTFKGGKHSNNPVLSADQPMPAQRPTRLAKMKNNPMEDDYIAGFSPFVMRDINSKSAQLAIRPGTEMKYWMKKNPNEARRHRKK